MSSSLPSSFTRRAVLGARPSSARIAADVCERARSSSSCPINVSDTITAAASKYTPTPPCAANSGGKISGAIVATTLYANDAAIPVPINVHMLGLRVAIEDHQRSKNGHAAHSTTGNESTS